MFPPFFIFSFSFTDPIVFLFSSLDRLAKNTLINALRKFALTPLDLNSNEQKKEKIHLTQRKEENVEKLQQIKSTEIETDQGNNNNLIKSKIFPDNQKSNGICGSSPLYKPEVSVNTVPALVDIAEKGSELLKSLFNAKSYQIDNLSDIKDQNGKRIKSFI